jgi:hypothetical protein
VSVAKLLKRRASRLRGKDDREIVTPPHAWTTATRPPEPGPEPKPSVKSSEPAAAVAAFDQICAARPLKPPPLPKHNDTRSTGAIALAKEIRLGDYLP